jgi:hypothetical protein
MSEKMKTDPAVKGKIVTKAEALSGSMTPAGKRVQTIIAPGSEVGPRTVEPGERLSLMKLMRWILNGLQVLIC